MSEKIIRMAKVLCEKFINKVETGRARSHETYAECKALLKTINETNNAMHSDGEGQAVLENVEYDLEYVDSETIRLTRRR